MSAEKTSELTRLSKAHLMVGMPTQCQATLVRLPQAPEGSRYVTPLRVSNYGEAAYEHIYSRVKDGSPLHKTHVLLNRTSTGQKQQPETGRNLMTAAYDGHRFP